ncbi:putative ribonuclease HII [Streptomyces sp. Tu6071]|nr:putative ribonuclease HII [Streptomyces sp. Tu6071]
MVAVENHPVGTNRESVEGPAGGEPQGGRHAELVDLLRRGVTEGVSGDPPLQLHDESDTSFGSEEFGVGQPLGGSPQPGDGGADRDGPGPGPASHFVDTCHDLGSGRGAERALNAVGGCFVRHSG